MNLVFRSIIEFLQNFFYILHEPKNYRVWNGILLQKHIENSYGYINISKL